VTRRLILAAAGAALLCSCSKNGAIVVGSKNFTEQIILGEIAAQQIEKKLHVPVERKLNLGGTLLTHEAIVRGDIDVYPEYTGTAASVILKQSPPADPVRVYMAVKDAYLQRFRLVWLPPLGFNDTFAMAVRSEDARKLREPSLSAALSRSWRLGIGYEFLTRPDGLQRLNRMYEIHWDGLPRSMDLGLLYQALRQKSIDMGAGNSTDAQLGDPKFTVLRDDRKAFPPYNACYIVRRELIQQKPQVEWALSMLQNRIGDETMRNLNRQVDIEHQPVETVVKAFLATQP
jgi:glycine betaine/choline ABC-type transport system substrate-binding protein